MHSVSYLQYIPLFPLLGALLCAVLGPRLKPAAVGALATVMVGASFAVSVAAFFEVRSGHQALQTVLYTWNALGGLTVDVGFLFDQLSAVMALVVTGVSTLIHLYSIGYIAHDRSPWRFFS